MSLKFAAGANQNWGRIIFISSESALQIPAEMIHYGMTKTAQLAVARGLAETTAGTQVTVHSVLPGPTASEGVNDFVENLAQQQQTGKAYDLKKLQNAIQYLQTTLMKHDHLDAKVKLISVSYNPATKRIE